MSKSSPPATTSNPTPGSSSGLSRRRWFAGAGAVGAAATVAAVLPGVASDNEASTPTAAAKPAKGGGYTVSEHIRRYYQTTRV